MEDIHDIKGLIEILSIWQKYLFQLIIILISVLVIIFILFLYFKKRKFIKDKPVEPNIPPFEKAIRELIETQELMKPGMDKILSTRISNIIRQYVESAFDFPSSEKTTEEFLHNIQKAMTFSSKVLEALAHFLEMCDWAKFAKIEFMPNEQRALYEKAKLFLETAHQEEPKPIMPEVSKGAKLQ